MENVVLTQLTVPEIRQILRQELEIYFDGKHESKKLNPESDQLLTIQQAGEFLKLTVATLYGYVHRAEIPVSKKGKRLYFSKHELTDWIKSGRRKTLAESSLEAEVLTKKKNR